jgi:ankyrin repeat protein
VGTPRAEIEGSSDKDKDCYQIKSFEVATNGAILPAPTSQEGLMLQFDLPELITPDFGLFARPNEAPANLSKPINFALEHQVVSPILSPSAVSSDHEKLLIPNHMVEEGLRVLWTQFDDYHRRNCGDPAKTSDHVMKGTESASQAASFKNYSNYLQIYVYLASNNLLSWSSTRKLVLLIAKTNSYSMLKTLLVPITTTIEIFMSTLLVNAAAVGDTKICRVLIEAGADLDAHSGQIVRTTPLHEAILICQTEYATMILEAGADPNLVVDGKTPLHYACLHSRYRSRFEIANLLLQHGAHVNPPQDCARLTPLQIAVQVDEPELVRLLLDKGADPNIFTTSKLGTALQIACNKSENAVIVELLINAGADIDSCSGYQCRDREEEEDSTDSEAESRSSEEEDDSDLFVNSVKPPILIAAAWGNWEAVQLLLEEGANANASLTRCTSKVLREELEGFEIPVSTPLQAAVRAEDITMTRMLLAYGAHVNQNMKGKYGFTALQIAAIVGNERLIKILLQKGAEINAPAGVYHGRTALQAAARHLDTKLLSLLLREGANVNTPPAFSKERLLCR